MGIRGESPKRYHDAEAPAAHVPLGTFDRNLSKIDGAQRL